MTTKPDIDTNFDQLEDLEDFRRRQEDFVETQPPAAMLDQCPRSDCSAIFILERRVDRHRKEIEEMKVILEATGKDISEVLEIVLLARSFFKVLGWIGDKLKPLMVIAAAITGTVAWIRYGGAK